MLSDDLGGNLYIGSDNIVTIPVLNAWSPTLLKLIDSRGTVRNLASSLTGTLTWNGSTLVDLTYLGNNYGNTMALTSFLYPDRSAVDPSLKQIWLRETKQLSIPKHMGVSKGASLHLPEHSLPPGASLHL